MPHAPDRRPILVTGSHRSGSTWVGKMIAAAPEIGYIHEPFNITYRRPGVSSAHFTHWLEYIPTGTGGPLRDALEDTLAFRYRYGAALRAARSPRDIARAARDAAQFERFRLSRRRPLMKDPLAIFSSEWLGDAFGMDVVVIIRHPAAFVTSIRRLGWSLPFADLVAQTALVRDLLHPYEAELRAALTNPPDIVEGAALLWKLIHHAVAVYQDRHPEWIFVRHEDLSTDPLHGFAAIYRRVHLPFTDDVRKIITQSTNEENPRGRAEATPHTTRLDSRANAYAWRDRVSREELHRIRELVEPYGSHFYTREEWAAETPGR